MWTSNLFQYPIFYIGVNLSGVLDFEQHQRLYEKEHNSTVAEQGTRKYAPEDLLTPEERALLAKDREISSEIWNNYRAFRSFENMPDKLLYWSDNLPKKEDVVILVTDRAILVHKSCVEVFQQFRLGKNRFTPLPLYVARTAELLSKDDWYLLALCEWRSFFIPEKSHPICKPINHIWQKNDGYNKHDFITSDYFGERDEGIIYAMSQDCINCDLDLWHDPQLRVSMCFSDALKDALEKAGMAEAWFFQPCKIVD